VTDVRAACQRGLAFVENAGSDLDAWCGRALLCDSPLRDEALHEEIRDAANDASAIGTAIARSLRIVGALDDLRALELAPGRAICAALESCQAADGSWGAAGSSEDERIFATGMLGGHFAKTRYARASMLDGAAEYLVERFGPERVQGGNWPAIAAYAHLFANLPHEEADAVLQWPGRELERGFRSGRFDAVRSARVILWCDAPSVPGARLGAPEVIERMLGEQQADGGWLRLDDPSSEARVAHTLDALAALVRLG